MCSLTQARTCMPHVCWPVVQGPYTLAAMARSSLGVQLWDTRRSRISQVGRICPHLHFADHESIGIAGCSHILQHSIVVLKPLFLFNKWGRQQAWYQATTTVAA